MTVTEFVVIEDGKEVDWIDPVLSLEETETHWHIDNGFSVYTVGRTPGRTHLIRTREVQR